MKKPLMEGIKTAKSVIKIMTLVIQNLQTNKECLQNAMTEELYATEKALQLVKKGMPFREAYKKIAQSFKKK
jgi:argininosuccinate lyase